MVVRHNTLRDALAETWHQNHLGIQVEAGNDLTADYTHTRPADLLLTNWTTGKTAAFDTSVTSPLNTHTLMEAGVSAGLAALTTEGRKHRANDAKCKELGWLCVPLVAETYGAWEMKLLKPSHSWLLGLPLLHAGPSRLYLETSMADSTSIQ